MLPQDRLEQIRERFAYVEARLVEGGGDIVKLSREHAELAPVVARAEEWQRLTETIEGTEAMLEDRELRDLAEEELPALKAQLEESESALRLALLPRDAADARPAMLEIRPGTGGDEASLFAADLARMYQRYAEARGWRFEVIEETEPERLLVASGELEVG